MAGETPPDPWLTSRVFILENHMLLDQGPLEFERTLTSHALHRCLRYPLAGQFGVGLFCPALASPVPEYATERTSPF